MTDIQQSSNDMGDLRVRVRGLQKSFWTTVVVTHEIRFAEHVADQVLFLDAGVVVERGTSAQVIGDPQEERTKLFLTRILDPA